MSKDPFEMAKGASRDVARSWQIGANIGTSISGWRLKRQLESEGYDALTVEAAVEALKAGRNPEPILQQARHAYQLRRKQAQMRRNPPPIHGSARWASAEELDQAGLFRPTNGHSLSLGAVNGEPLTWDGESHLLTVAPTRTGKGTMQIIPNLLNYRGSAVVLDPKGEICTHTAKWREENVGPVHVINPFGVAGVPTAQAFNPLDQVTDAHSAMELAEILYPRTHDEKQQFFENEAIAFLTAVLEFTARFAAPGFRNLGTIRDSISTLDQGLFGLVKAMADATMPPSIRNAATNFKTKSRDTGQPRVLDSLNTHMRIWDSEGLRRCTARTDFTFQGLKDQPATVYLVLPFDKIGAYSTFVRMIFATALDAMLGNPSKPDIPVLFVLDEFLALDRDDRFVSALRTHASAGVRLWFFLQDLPTLEQKYPTTWKSFLQVETKTFFATDDPYTAELVSRYLGDQTVAYEVPNMSASTTGGTSASASYSISENLHLTARKLLTPDEVMAFMAGDYRGRKAIHFLRNLRPVQADLTPWFEDELLKERV
ncbi:type IV secretory system conjugative DNA transfer family protein [Oricola sp.]|uniref:type IV secretory system conjugative DNA transfer family protein n=1 Tax=Oricola sp. TaxID=1979950 RepID=UPI0025FC5717|nr:type IV secretory system conjugative DNA transfer family protein [Oricola sp.]MCI5076437.1 type IV secretory system conjugative DNA transfer family protein [Oricola sp.]